MFLNNTFFTLLFILATCFTMSAQTISETSEIRSIMDRYAATNRMNPTIKGWRIQVLATTDRRKMEQTKDKFIQKYPFLFIDWIHSAPYYKLHVGAFRTKLDAMRTLQQFKSDFPGAYPRIENNIRKAELVGL